MTTTKTTTKTQVPARDVILARIAKLRDGKVLAEPVSITVTEAATSTLTPADSITLTPATVSTLTPATPEETAMTDTPDANDTPDAHTAEVEGMMDRIEAHDVTIDGLNAKRREVEERMRAELAAIGAKVRAAEDARRVIVAELVRDYGDEVVGNTLTEEGAQEVIDEVMAEVRRAAGEDADLILAKLKIDDFVPTIDGGADLPASTMARMKTLIDASCTLKDGGGADTGELVDELREYVRERATKVGILGPSIIAAVDSALETTCHWSATPARRTSAGAKVSSKAKNPRQYVEGAVTAIHLPGYVDTKGLGVEAKVYVAADGQRKVTLGGRGIPAYVERIGHPSRARATLELERMATQWAKDAGYLRD